MIQELAREEHIALQNGYQVEREEPLLKELAAWALCATTGAVIAIVWLVQSQPPVRRD